MRPRAFTALLFLALLVFYFARIAGFPLQEPDEGRYAEIAREMAISGDWVTPRLHYVNYFDKPPLLYWLVAGAFRALGSSEGVARLVPASAGVVTVFITFLLGRSMFGPNGGFLAAVILATSPLFFLFSQALTTDMLLTSCMTGTLGAFWAERHGKRKRLWGVVAAVIAALGVLAKGLVAVLLPGIVAIVFLVCRGERAALRRVFGPVPIAVFLILVAPWFVAVSWSNPEFAEYFFVIQHLERFTTAAVGHPEGPLFYLPVLLGGGLPWTVLVGSVMWRSGVRATYRRLPSEDRTFLILWALAILVFFTLARSKLPAYILPAFPPLALLAAGLMISLEDRAESVARVAYQSVAAFVVASATLVVAALIARVFAQEISEMVGRDRQDVEVVVNSVLLAAASSGLASCLVLAGWSRIRAIRASSLHTVGGVVGACAAILLFLALGAREAVKTSREVGRAIRELHRPGDVIVSYRRLMHGLPFYTEVRGVQAVDYGELRFGARFAPDGEEFFWYDKARVVAAWESGRRVFVATSRKFEQELRAVLRPQPSVLLRDADRVVLVNFSAGRDDALVARDSAGEVDPDRAEKARGSTGAVKRGRDAPGVSSASGPARGDCG